MLQRVFTVDLCYRTAESIYSKSVLQDGRDIACCREYLQYICVTGRQRYSVQQRVFTVDLCYRTAEI